MRKIWRDQDGVAAPEVMLDPIQAAHHITLKDGDDLLDIVHVVQDGRGIGKVDEEQLDVFATQAVDDLVRRSLLGMRG